MTDLELLEMDGNDTRMSEIEDQYMREFGCKIDNAGGDFFTYRQTLQKLEK